MNWYYVEGGQQAGPVSEAEFLNLVGTGKVQPDTLVWQEGMANWQPYSALRAGGSGAVPPNAPPPMLTGSAGTVAGGSEVVCAECGKIFSRDNAIQYGTTWICAACKPIFVQKFKEGAALPTGSLALDYAGFWIRFGSLVVDWLILWVVNLGISMLAGLSFMTAVGANPNAGLTFLQIILMFVQLGIGITSEIFFLGKYGATPGKMAVKIRVVNADGTRITYLRAAGRYFARFLSGLVCGIGFIIAAFDSEKRALHDHICNTRVIRQ
jgi:uncharacterized RDD family membrane protein YckC